MLLDLMLVPDLTFTISHVFRLGKVRCKDPLFEESSTKNSSTNLHSREVRYLINGDITSIAFKDGGLWQWTLSHRFS